MATESIKDLVLQVAPLLPKYTATRMPYTYHHDYLRMYVDKFKGTSRAFVAEECKNATDDELYAVAFVQIISELDGSDLLSIDSEDQLLVRDVFRKAKEIITKLEY